MTNKEHEDTNSKKQISDFKQRADNRNKSLYSDVTSFKKGLFLILAVVSIVLLYFYFFS